MTNDDMLEGYFDGLRDDRLELPKTFSNRSRSYCHGWLNGRDDRTRNPRAPAYILRLQAIMAEFEDKGL